MGDAATSRECTDPTRRPDVPFAGPDRARRAARPTPTTPTSLRNPPYHARVRPASLAVLCLATVVASAVPKAAAADVTGLIDRLDAPFLSDREEAVEALVAAGPRARDAVVASFLTPGHPRRPELARVLAADGSAPALHALLAVLPTLGDAAEDLATTRAVQQSLVEHAERVADAVLAWRDERGEVPRAVADVAGLLVRARVETRFLSRKSASGHTGSYPGQFDLLRPDREAALEVGFHVLRDRELKVPGRFPSGTYRFLRRPEFLVEPLELQLMALHALSELLTPQDSRYLDALTTQYVRYHQVLTLSRNGRFDRPVEASLSDGILAVLARHRPDHAVPEEILLGVQRRGPRPGWLRVAEGQIDELSRGTSADVTDAAQLAMQIGRFDRAVDIYTRLVRSRPSGVAYYNLACAYARWSREPSPDRDPDALRLLAMRHMEHAVEAGYPDWVWMSEDRDLDPIRDLPRFAALIERMKQSFQMPAEGRPGRPR